LHAPAIGFEAVLGEEANGLRVGDFLLFKDAVGKGFGRVVFEHGAGALEDDRAIVVFLINEMHGASRDFAAMGKALFARDWAHFSSDNCSRG